MATWPEIDEAALKESIKVNGAEKTLTSLKRGEFSGPQPFTITGGVGEVWPSGQVDAALETNEGRFLVAPSWHSARPGADPQVFSNVSQSSGNGVYLRELLEEIQRSQEMLSLEPDWDDEGAEPVSESTWRRATEFLKRQAEHAWQTQRMQLPVPSILPGPLGSVDLDWETIAFELLVNVPSTKDAPATFYGDDYDTTVIKGTVNTTQVNQGLLAWLMRV